MSDRRAYMSHYQEPTFDSKMWYQRNVTMKLHNETWMDDEEIRKFIEKGLTDSRALELCRYVGVYLETNLKAIIEMEEKLTATTRQRKRESVIPEMEKLDLSNFCLLHCCNIAGNHWGLVVYIAIESIQMRTFFVFDSRWQDDNYAKYNYEIQLLGKMMSIENSAFDQDYFNFSNVESPLNITCQQDNSSDCGLYVCYWATEIAQVFQSEMERIQKNPKLTGDTVDAGLIRSIRCGIKAKIYDAVCEELSDEFRDQMDEFRALCKTQKEIHSPNK